MTMKSFRFVFASLIILSLVLYGCYGSRQKRPNELEGSKMRMVDAKTIAWEDPPRGYYLTAVKQKVLWKDEKTGAMMALVKFPVGVADKIHTHPEANQFTYILSGEIEREDGSQVPGEGIFAHIPKGEKHGRTKITKESIMLFYWDGPPTPQTNE